MSVEPAQVGLAESEPADVTLDSVIENAISGAEESAAAVDDVSTGHKPDKTGRLHGEGGKFVPKTNSAAEASLKEPAQAAQPDAPKAGADPALVQPIEPPARWTADEKAKFATWPRDVQEAVLERNKAMEADHTRKTQEAADTRRTVEPLLNALRPFENYLQQLGPITGKQTPELISGLLGVEYRLRTGAMQEKVSTLLNIGREYGVDLAAYITGGGPIEPDPQFNQMRQEVSELRHWKTQFEQQAQQQQAEQTSLHIESFTAAKDEAGRPRYPHFDRVRGVMAQSLMNGEARTLEEAYQKATAPIQEAIAEELRNRQSQADTQRKEAVAKAEKASPVRSSGSHPGGSTKGNDLDSILSDSMARHGM